MQDQNDQIERVLMRYRPAGPNPKLRERVLSMAEPTPIHWTWPLWTFRSALAAVVLLALGLNHAAEQINHATAVQVGIGPVIWTADAEQAAKAIGGEQGRQYIAVCLMARRGCGTQSHDVFQPKGAIQ